METLLEAFILTNGSNTFPMCLKSVQDQSLPVDITIIENKSIVKAMNLCVTKCRKPFFVKVDDDMFLHPNAMLYLNDRVRDRFGMYTCKLYEPWRNRLVRCIKAYNTKVSRQIGFQADQRGKIDTLFLDRLGQTPNRVVFDHSVVAIHALRDVDSQTQYRNMWIARSNCTPDKFKKMDPDQYKVYNNVPSLISQYNAVHELYQFNKGTGFELYSQPRPKDIDRGEYRFFNSIIVRHNLIKLMVIANDYRLYTKLGARKTQYVTTDAKSCKIARKIASKRDKGLHRCSLIDLSSDWRDKKIDAPDLLLIGDENPDIVQHYLSHLLGRCPNILIKAGIDIDIPGAYDAWECNLSQSKWIFLTQSIDEWGHYTGNTVKPYEN